MFDAQSLIGAFLNAKGTPSAGDRMQRAVGPQGMGGQGGLLDQLGGMLGGGGGSGAGGGGLQGMLSQLSGATQSAVASTGDAVKSNNPLAVGGLGAVAGALLGGRGGAVGGGALALLGSLAYAALQAAQSPQQPGQPAAAAPTAPAAAVAPAAADLPIEVRGASSPADHAVLESRALVLLRAMISAAKADGTVDQDEMDRIFKKLDEAGTDTEARDYVLQEMRAPLDLDGLIAQAKAPDLAAQVYAASLLAIEVDSDAERAYLARLAQGLALPPAAIAHIHQTLGVPQA